MSNPVVTVGGSIPEIGDPTIVRTSYTMNSFDVLNFFIYPKGTILNGLDPTDMGQEAYFFYQLQDVIAKPSFITSGCWSGVGSAPSGFVTPNNSIMPKRLTPSLSMVDNGIISAGGKMDGIFNWKIDSVNGDTKEENWYKYASVSLNSNEKYVSISVKDYIDSTPPTASIHLESPTVAPTGGFDSSKLVVGGAFMLMLNIQEILSVGDYEVEVDSGSDAVEASDDDDKWSIEIKFGDVTMTIGGAATMSVEIAGEKNVTNVNLAEGLAKESNPQSSFVDKPLVIGVYPVWNGICVVTGLQETKEVVFTSSTFCRKLRSAAIQDSNYSNGWFDSEAPSDVEIEVGSGALSTKVNFGSRMDVYAKNCNFEIAYLPSFFSSTMAVDGWKLLTNDTDEVTYLYELFTIYTKNGTAYALPKDLAIEATEYEGESTGTLYWKVPWRLTNGFHARYAGEIFAYVLKTEETRNFSIKNGNGSFDLNWTGGMPGNKEEGDWTKYITNVTISTGLDGSSGSITVDKYGVAGQDARAIQSIGEIVLNAEGGVGTFSGKIFAGIAMGIGEEESNGDATWTIPLIGLEKKLEDICLINPPFMDGETVAHAVGYLARYAGITYEIHGNGGQELSGTADIMEAVFNWTSGTSVKTALEDIMVDTHFTYTIIDGVMHVYELDEESLPKYGLGPDRSGGYDTTNIVSADRTPDFEDLRNYTVGVALQKVPQGTGTNINNTPTYPMIILKKKNTVPDVPWAKCWVNPVPGVLTYDELEDIVDRMDQRTYVYELIGRTQIAGNANIKPFDMWGSDYVIMSVAHNIDLKSKTWTTDLEFMRKAN